MSSLAVVVGLTRLAADAAEAIEGAASDGLSPSEVASRGLDILVQLVPVQELRGYLDALDAASAEHITDIAEDAKLAVKRMGG